MAYQLAKNNTVAKMANSGIDLVHPELNVKDAPTVLHQKMYGNGSVTATDERGLE